MYLISQFMINTRSMSTMSASNQTGHISLSPNNIISLLIGGALY